MIIAHASLPVPPTDSPFAKLFLFGPRGVQLFFVASALTLMLSWHSRHDGVLRFYARRVFRIAPMFWLATVVFTALYLAFPKDLSPLGVDPLRVLATFLFAHAWHPRTILSMVPGGWSIGVEMSFYLLFPLLAFAIRGWIGAVLFVVAAIVLSGWQHDYVWLHRQELWPGWSDQDLSVFFNMGLPEQFPVFTVGIPVYFLTRDLKCRIPLPWLNAMLLASVLTGVWLCYHQEPIRKDWLVVNLYSLYALCFGVFAYCLANGAGRFLVNAPMQHLGRISFSAYLWHLALQNVDKMVIPYEYYPRNPAAFFLLYFTGMMILTVLFSNLTYRYVEQPAIRFGNRLLGPRKPASRPPALQE